MAYDPTLPGLEEARLDAYQAFLQSKLSDLNTSLARSGFNSTHGLVSITSAMVIQGNSETMFDLSDAPLQVRLTNGDELNGEDFESKLGLGVVYNAGWQYFFVTHVYVFVHPELFYNTDAQLQQADRERCLNRLSDWIIGEINYWNPNTQTGGTIMPLTSAIIGIPVDKLVEGTVTRITRDMGGKSFGNSTNVPTLYARIESNIL
jgi:hypothetical protein